MIYVLASAAPGIPIQLRFAYHAIYPGMNDVSLYRHYCRIQHNSACCHGCCNAVLQMEPTLCHQNVGKPWSPGSRNLAKSKKLTDGRHWSFTHRCCPIDSIQSPSACSHHHTTIGYFGSRHARHSPGRPSMMHAAHSQSQ